MWQFIILLALLYCATIMPFKVCFINTSSISWLIFDTIIDFIFLTDMVIVLNSPFICAKKQCIEVSRKNIFFNYLKGWLLIDFLSSIPMDFLTHFFFGGMDQNALTNDMIKLMRIPRIYRIMRITRLYRVANLF